LPSEAVSLASVREYRRNGFTFGDLRSRLAQSLNIGAARLENPFRWDFCGVQVSL
jgi:hypothetical protein